LPNINTVKIEQGKTTSKRKDKKIIAQADHYYTFFPGLYYYLPAHIGRDGD
jgi:hypothetical protein